MKGFHRAKEIIKQEGIVGLVKSSIDFVRWRAHHLLGDDVHVHYHEKRTDNEYRWDFIKPYISDQDTLIDLGCANGYFVAKAAEQGILSLGIDNLYERISNAQSTWGLQQNIGFANWEITPENVSELPSPDVILLLTVYHHFVNNYGQKRSEEMFRELASKSEVIIYEPPGDRYSGITLEFQAKNTETEEVHEFAIGPRPRIVPEINNKLPAGNYEIKISTEGYSSSDYFEISIPEKGEIREGNKPRVHLMNRTITVTPGGGHDEIDDVIEWYSNQIDRIFDSDVEIIDNEVTEYKGRTRKDPIFVLDTSDYYRG